MGIFSNKDNKKGYCVFCGKELADGKCTACGREAKELVSLSSLNWQKVPMEVADALGEQKKQLFGNPLYTVKEMITNGDLFIADIHAVENDLPIGRRFQQVQAAQKGALAAAGGADDADHFLCVERGADIIENRQLAEALGQVADFDHFIFCHEPSSFPSGRSAARQ